MDRTKNVISAKRAAAALLALLLLFSLCACGSLGAAKAKAQDLLENYEVQSVEVKVPDDIFRKAMLSFSVKLTETVAKDAEQGENVLLSPLSVLTAMTMTANGAAGDTLKEMEKVLGGGLSVQDLNAYLAAYYHSLAKSETITLKSANAIWINNDWEKEIKTSFLQTNVNYFNPAIRRAAFDSATLRDINEWVSMKTNKMIPKVLDDLDKDAIMVLLNALCFEAKWNDPFKSTNVREATFTTEAGEKQNIEMMYTQETDYLYKEGLYSGFMKSYVGSRYAFVALLPQNGTSISDFLGMLSAETLAGLNETKSMEPIEIGLPRFSYDFSRDLIPYLKAMGLTSPFGPAADFSAMTGDPGEISIGYVIHKTHIDVDSDGTKAAAVTAVIPTKAAAMPAPSLKVFLDRPFVYMLWDTETGLPLFIGVVNSLK